MVASVRQIFCSPDRNYEDFPNRCAGLERRLADSVGRLDLCETFDRVRVPLHQIDEESGLGIGLRPTLLPVLESSGVGPEIPREQPSGDVPRLAQLNQLPRRDVGNGLELHRMSAQRALGLPRFAERREAFSQ